MARTQQREAGPGPNKTGIATSPKQIEKMLAGMDTKLAEPSSEGDEREMARMRASYIENAEPVGSVPPPAPQLLLDKLGERLAVERTATRLYDALIAKFRTQPEKAIRDEELVRIRNEEAKHFALLSDCIQKLGGDPTAQTPCADVAGVEALGLVQVITDPKTTIAQSLHAILVAELTDNAAWEDLIELAEKMGQSDLVPEFEQALGHEAEHLTLVRGWLHALMEQESGLAK
jgi:rubrerythrin